jgi:hypothetical protein
MEEMKRMTTRQKFALACITLILVSCLILSMLSMVIASAFLLLRSQQVELPFPFFSWYPSRLHSLSILPTLVWERPS